MNKQLPVRCPSCNAMLKVRRLECGNCDTAVEGRFVLSIFDYLSIEEQSFMLSFVKSSGSLKEMALQLQLSYPSVRNMLNDIIERMNAIESTIEGHEN
jgi:hypothetical protein